MTNIYPSGDPGGPGPWYAGADGGTPITASALNELESREPSVGVDDIEGLSPDIVTLLKVPSMSAARNLIAPPGNTSHITGSDVNFSRVYTGKAIHDAIVAIINEIRPLT